MKNKFSRQFLSIIKKPFSSIALYTFLLWVLTIFISTIIIGIIEGFIQGKIPRWNNQIVYFIFGLILSLPAFILLGLIIKFITHNKLVLIIISILLPFLSFYVYRFNFDPNNLEDYILPGTHSIVLSVLLSFLRLKNN